MNTLERLQAGLLVLAALSLPLAASAAQEKGSRTAGGLAAALERQTRKWADSRVEDAERPGLDREAIEELVAPGSLLAPRHATLADVAGTPVFRLNRRGGATVVGDASGWAAPGAFPFGLGSLEDPANRQVDIRRHARNLVKQRIVKEILSRTAFGRGLGLLIDTGAPAAGGPEGLDTRSKMLPYVSPNVDASEGKVELRLTWKF